MNKYDNATAARIKALRLTNKLTQKELADLVGVKPTTVSSWERGTTRPTFERTKVLAEVLHTDSNYLLGTQKVDTKDKTRIIDLENDPVVLSYGGKPATKEDMDVILAILKRHKENE